MRIKFELWQCRDCGYTFVNGSQVALDRHMERWGCPNCQSENIGPKEKGKDDSTNVKK